MGATTTAQRAGRGLVATDNNRRRSKCRERTPSQLARLVRERTCEQVNRPEIDEDTGSARNEKGEQRVPLAESLP